MTESTHTVCSTSNCDNRATHDSGGQLVCGTCLHGMFTLPEPRLMDEAAREAARKLVSVWCENAMPAGWTLARPGRIDVETDGPDLAIEVHPGRTLVRVGRAMVRISAVEAAIASVIAGRSPGLVWALEAALDDGDALRGVIARAIQASGNPSNDDPELAIERMLAILFEPEPEGHDDRIEWARMEGANAMLEVIQREGYGARGIADNRDGLRKTVAELAVSSTMPRNPEPEFEAALLQREVEQLRAQLAATQAELRTALRVLDHVAPRPWEANLDDPHDEQDSGEFDDGEWVITDASEREIDRSSAGTSWADGVTNGSWSREYVADVNALGATIDPPSEETSG